MFVFNWKILAESFEKSFIFWGEQWKCLMPFCLRSISPFSARKSLSHDSLACLDFNAVIVCFISSLCWHVSTVRTEWNAQQRLKEIFMQIATISRWCPWWKDTAVHLRDLLLSAMCRNDRTWMILLTAHPRSHVPPNVPQRTASRAFEMILIGETTDSQSP